MMKKHLVIVGNPVPEDWEFQRGLQQETGQEWQVMRWCINEYTGLKKIHPLPEVCVLPVLPYRSAEPV